MNYSKTQGFFNEPLWVGFSLCFVLAGIAMESCYSLLTPPTSYPSLLHSLSFTGVRSTGQFVLLDTFSAAPTPNKALACSIQRIVSRRPRNSLP